MIGIAVGPTKEEDSGSRYHCEIHRGNERVESSKQSILYVGGKWNSRCGSCERHMTWQYLRSLTLYQPMTHRCVIVSQYAYGNLYGGVNTRRYTSVHGLCFFKLFLWSVKG